MTFFTSQRSYCSATAFAFFARPPRNVTALFFQYLSKKSILALTDGTRLTAAAENFAFARVFRKTRFSNVCGTYLAQVAQWFKIDFFCEIAFRGVRPSGGASSGGALMCSGSRTQTPRFGSAFGRQRTVRRSPAPSNSCHVAS